MSTFDVVIPTVGRSSVSATLESLVRAGCRAGQIVVVDDSARTGPAAARNRGAAATDAAWIVFLDDDVVVTQEWQSRLEADLESAPSEVGAVQGKVVVPLPSDRRPTDWERNTAHLETAAWITADLAVRREALAQVGGFDERFHRAYREDSDLALRLQEAGWALQQGTRTTLHPVRPASDLVSLTSQKGNADDALMVALHGRDFRRRLGERRSIMWRHALTTVAALIAAASALARRRRPFALAGGAWVALTGHFALARILPGPRTAREIGRMVTTSVLIPPLACWHRVLGVRRARRLAADA